MSIDARSVIPMPEPLRRPRRPDSPMEGIQFTDLEPAVASAFQYLSNQITALEQHTYDLVQVIREQAFNNSAEIMAYIESWQRQQAIVAAKNEQTLKEISDLLKGLAE